MTEIGSELRSHGDELGRRLRELGAVHRIVEAAVAADELDAVLDEAVDAIIDAVAVDRAAVLLHDEDGVMRFRAWRGLSETYRAAVEGHSPWSADQDDFAAVTVSDALDEPTFGEGLRRAIAAEGIRTLAFVPLVHRHELLGKLMLYRDELQEFTEADLQLAQTIAGAVAGAVQRTRAEQLLRESNRQLDIVFRHVADGITVQDPAGNLLFANEAAARTIGAASVEELLATPLQEIVSRFSLVDEGGEPFAVDELPNRMALRGIDVGPRLVGWRSRETGEERWSVLASTPVYSEDGRLELVINVFRDVTERRRQEHGLTLLARAGDVLAQSLDVEQTLAEVARLAVPAVGDWCIVYVQEPSGSLRRLAVEHAGGRHHEVLARLRQHDFRADAEIGVPAVVRTGEAQLHQEADSSLVASDVFDGDRLAEELEDLGICSWMCVPLTARGRTFGALSFLATESKRRFDAKDLEVAAELARRAALAVDNARLYAEAQRSLALLDAILASAPTAIGFWDRDIRYVRVNEALAALNELAPEDHIGKHLSEVVPDLAPVLEPVYRNVVETGRPIVRYEASTDLGAHRLGQDRHWLSSYFPVKTEDGEVLGVGAVIMEITERKQAEDTAAARARQQADVAELGQLALAGAEVSALMRDAAVRIADTLEVEFVEVLELLPNGRLLLCDGVGWREGEVGAATVSGGHGSQGGFTLEAAEPVIVEDLTTEARFTPSPLLREHEVTSGVTVMIPGEDMAFGVLGAHAADWRRFTQDDVNYLQAVANVIAAALERSRLAEAERRAHDRLSFLAEASRLLGASLDYQATLKAVAQLAGTEIADWMAVYMRDEDGQPRRIVGRHPDPEKDALVQELLASYSRPLDESSPMYGVVHERKTLLVEEVTDEMLVEAAVDERHLELLRALGFVSAIAVPLTVKGQGVGALSFIRAHGAPYTRDDVGLAEEVARRASLAVENARLYQAAQLAQREAEERAQAAQALEFVGDGVFLIDHAGIVRLWNPAAETVTGLPATQVVGRPAEDAIPGWATLSGRVPVTSAVVGASVRPQTLPLELGGRELWLSISGVGFAHGTVFAFRDVTEEQAVEKLKSDFVSTISHELRTPLAAIYGAALTLRRPDMPIDLADRTELLSVIAGEAERLAGIVNDILWTSRIESGGLHVTMEACDGIELARSVVRAAELQLPPNLHVRLEAPGELPRVLADADKVRQVLSNLVENAVKYSPDGGVVVLRVEQLGDRIRFLVTDEGLGIPPREQERIFEKFYRLDPNLTRGVGGTGLGLYICRELISRMGGAIRVESTEGTGSTFTVELPAAEEAAAAALAE